MNPSPKTGKPLGAGGFQLVTPKIGSSSRYTCERCGVSKRRSTGPGAPVRTMCPDCRPAKKPGAGGDQRNNALAVANRSKTRCPEGHPYDEANTYVSKGGRTCKACTIARGRLARLTRRLAATT